MAAYKSLHSDVELKDVSHADSELQDQNAGYGADPVQRHSLAKPDWYSRIVLDWWFWEIGSSILGILCVVATAVILSVYNGKKAPELPRYITLNAIISILATVIKATIIVAVAAGISQLKWLWLQDTRSLHDLQIFDDASRGPLGALHMAFYLRGRHLASLGALIAVLAVAMEPFMQQLMVYPVEVIYTPSPLAAAPRTDNVSYFAQQMGDETMGLQLETGFMNSIYNGDEAPKVEPICPTGNCTWPIYHSLGVCSRCTDMTKQVKLEGACTPGDFLAMEKNCTISLPHGAPVVNPYDVYTSSAATILSWVLNYETGYDLEAFSAASPQLKGTYSGVENPLFALGWLEIDYSDLENKNPVSMAMECAFTYCLKKYNFTVNAAVPSLDASPVHYASMDQQSGWTIKAPLLANGSNASDITFTVDDSASYHVWSILEKEITGNASTWPESTEFFIPSSTFIGKSPSIPDKPHMFENIAVSLTDAILKPSNQTVSGLLGRPEQFVRIRWAWIVLPGFLVVATVVFLSMVMLRSRKYNVNVWKSSSLALLYHGLEVPAERNGPVRRVSDMTQYATTTKARMTMSGSDEWRLQAVDRRGDS
ncbi:hypothetical protein FQN50_004300 [Emmonsiellopsis sp. PD_5]|nr:hypothetical protein FQN50_004300 [Emmonsiellopsis sp. PD_5]